MRVAGYVAIALGFLLGSFGAVADPQGIDWLWFTPATIIGVLGVFVVRLALLRRAKDVQRIDADLRDLDAHLRSIIAGVGELRAGPDAAHLAALPRAIDNTLRESIGAFVAAREAILHARGARAFAEIMSRFSAGERYLNRAWSAAVDEYPEEARSSLETSRGYFVEALERFESERARAG